MTGTKEQSYGPSKALREMWKYLGNSVISNNIDEAYYAVIYTVLIKKTSSTSRRTGEPSCSLNQRDLVIPAQM